MSTWGTGPFDNDDAAAWCDELDAAEDPVGFAVDTLRTAGDSARVVAAAAWLAAGVPGSAEPVHGPSTPAATPGADMADDALPALEAVLDDGAWSSRWEDEADQEAAHAVVRGLIETWELTVA